MANMLDQNIIINAAPAAWAYVFEKNGTTGKYELPSIVGTAPTKRLRFDNTNGATIGLVRPDAVAAAAADEFVQITRGDGAIIEFIKNKLTLDGATGNVKGGTGVTSDGGSKGTIAFETNQADVDSADYMAFLNKLQSLIGATFLICVPIGENYLRKAAGATTGDTNSVGYAFMLGTLSADLSHAIAAYTPAKIAFAFQSKKLSVQASDITTSHAAVDLGDTGNAILVPTGMDGATVVGTTYAPPSISVLSGAAITADFQKLLDGEVLFKAS